ncbi:uncharacterized protein GGS22DRAFT_157848 [Annulohypoxylon maeteangense]|uniref:uncharacterized protein n=1 Tax=Annulohypoxylon maeteangense TaxID=1927788 RepID=UPI0020086964|nr:uncharacterized protein GGS22DRAFT_157848 [Annulohypoxylon maeteangense]KAI0887675.1 hypothetical protein GGS22DRAFT_157848 [Annulohypoxylon maeteangense]
MEQPQPLTPTDIPTAVPPPPYTDRAAHPIAVESSKPDSLDHISNSVPYLRFPRPLGNRKLTNWVSSSSPDIMQPENIPDDEPSLAELGYDVIGTDGESQAESTASSLDYQRPDDVQSLGGTDTGTDVDTNDADTDSSDEDEEDEEEATALHDAPIISTISSTVVEFTGDADDEDADVETLVNQSLENPTDFSQHGFPALSRLLQADQDEIREVPSTEKFPIQDAELGENVKHILSSSGKNKPLYQGYDTYHLTLRHVRRNRRVLVALSGLAILYSLAITGKYFLFSPHTPRVLSTVPVAAVSSAAVPSHTGNSVTTSVVPPTLALAQTQKALQTGGSSPNSLMFVPFGKDKAQTGIPKQSEQQPICSVELYDRNEIMVNIPRGLKSTWLSRDAILIAVSRGLYDIPTKVSSVEEGFLIEVPLEEAHDVLAVSIATTWKPKIQETFRVDFGRNKFIGALDAGKQLVKGFAQKLVDTVNETTAWVEETYIPALDVVSKQVCIQTSSVSDSLLQGLRDVGNAILSLPSQITAQITTPIKLPFNADNIAQRQHQAQLQLVREAQDLRDELALRYLSAQLRSKLWWLRIRGRTEEYQRYLSKAEIYLGKRVADAKTVKQERAEQLKKLIRTRRKHERHETRGSFWRKGMGQFQN